MHPVNACHQHLLASPYSKYGVCYSIVRGVLSRSREKSVFSSRSVPSSGASHMHVRCCTALQEILKLQFHRHALLSSVWLHMVLETQCPWLSFCFFHPCCSVLRPCGYSRLYCRRNRAVIYICRTLFDRLLEGGMQADLLAVQYRMHAAICDFPNRWFYGGRLATGTLLHPVLQPLVCLLAVLVPCVLIDYGGYGACSGRCPVGGVRTYWSCTP